jgi:4-alpha-glucanotransferase
MRAVSGVPPDYFSTSGQLWNMPVFRWEIMQKDGFKWWKNRIRKNLELFDLLRLDHFRGFSAFWEVPAGEKTAVNGRWIKGPGELFFDEIRKDFPEMPFVAEDLGEIDQPVYDLRDKYDLPGMRVLQFAFGKDSSNSIHINHNHIYNCITYTGTHDNNTITGWFTSETSPVHHRNLENYLGKKPLPHNIHKELVRLAYSSVAKIVIIPFQDFPGLGTFARMNTPSVKKGNWLWRLSEHELKPAIEKNIKTLVKTFGRI